MQRESGGCDCIVRLLLSLIHCCIAVHVKFSLAWKDQRDSPFLFYLQQDAVSLQSGKIGRNDRPIAYLPDYLHSSLLRYLIVCLLIIQMFMPDIRIIRKHWVGRGCQRLVQGEFTKLPGVDATPYPRLRLWSVLSFIFILFFEGYLAVQPHIVKYNYHHFRDIFWDEWMLLSI